MKVALLTTWDEPCGIADYSAALAEALRPHAEVRVVPVRHGQTDPAYFRGLGRQCNGADLAHLQHEYIFFGGRDPWSCRWPHLLRELRVPYAVTAHTWLNRFSGGPAWKRVFRGLRDGVYGAAGWTRYLRAGQFAGARRILVHTASHRGALIAQGLPSERIRVVPQGVPDHFPRGRRDEAARRWGFTGPVVSMFGFLTPAKGHLLALAAWELVQPDATLVIAGKPFSAREDAYARQVHDLAARQSGRVLEVGYLPETELADLLAASDLVLMPYTGGTSSYALSLALAQGCAVLASDLPQFLEIRAEDPCLEVFHAGDAADLAERMMELLEDSGHRLRLSEAARVWARGHRWSAVGEQTAGIYREILSGM